MYILYMEFLKISNFKVVGAMRLELITFRLSDGCANLLRHGPIIGWKEGDRTLDLMGHNHAF